MTLNVLLEEGEDGWIVAHVPALRGCVSQGETRQAALANIKEAIEGWLEVEQEKSEFPVPGTRAELVAVAV
jgi:predicted RNase H-like HicB family nuclease